MRSQAELQERAEAEHVSDNRHGTYRELCSVGSCPKIRPVDQELAVLWDARHARA